MDYIKIIFLIIYYIALLCFCHYESRKILITPEFCFIGCFLPQLIYALFYVKRWNIDLSAGTMAVYMLGGTIFIVSGIMARHFLGRKLIDNTQTYIKVNSIKLNKLFLMAFIFVQVASLVIVANAIEQATGRYNLAEAIDMFGFLSKGSGLEMPSIPGKLNMLCYTSSFLWAYYLIHSYVFKYKSPKILLFINLALSTVHHTLTGSRGGVVELVIAAIVFWYLFQGEKKHWSRVIPFKSLFKIILIMVALLVVFRLSLEMLGRTATEGEAFSDYIARYLSAELKNIDTRIVQGKMGFTDILNSNTLSPLVSFFFKIFGFKYTGHLADESTYLSINGFGLGNVYTIYYSMIQDLHYLGLFVFLPIMAVICEWSFVFAIRANRLKNKNIGLRMSVVIYGYIVSKLIFSFFSNRFYGNIISTGTIWCIAFWMIVKYASEKNLNKGYIYISDRLKLKLR